MRSSIVVRRDISVQTYLGTIAEGIHLASALRLFLWQREELHPAPLCGAQSSTTRARAGSVDPRGRGGRSRAKRLIRDPAKLGKLRWRLSGKEAGWGWLSECRLRAFLTALRNFTPLVWSRGSMVSTGRPSLLLSFSVRTLLAPAHALVTCVQDACLRSCAHGRTNGTQGS